MRRAILLAVSLVVAVPPLTAQSTPISIRPSNIRRVTSDPGLEFQPAISPGGKEVAYVVGPIGNPRIVVKNTRLVGGGGESRLAEEVSGDHWLPAWTPDGASLRFWAYTRGLGWDVKEVGRVGGSVRTVSHRSSVFSPDGTRVVGVRGDSIFAYAEDHGEPELLGVHVERPGGLHSLAWSPDGRLIAYVNGNPNWRYSADVAPASIWILDVDRGEPAPVTDQEHLNVSPQWLPDSRHLLFVSDRDGPRGIYVVEVGSEGPRGAPQAVLGSSDAHSISVSADGRRLAYSRFTKAANIWSIGIPQAGVASIKGAVPVTKGNQGVETHSLSPDGAWVVFDSYLRGELDIYKQPLAGGDPQLVADITGHAKDPDWSPDGAEIAFYSAQTEGPGGRGEIFVVSAEGGTPEQLTDFPGLDMMPAWSPDGLALAYHSQGPQGVGLPTIWIVSRDSVGLPWSDPVQLTDFGCWRPDWAPDGASLACTALQGGAWVRVSRDGDVLARYDLSTAGLRSLVFRQFSPDGSRIYFRAIQRDGSQGVWWIPATGGDAVKVVAFDDLSREVLGDLTVGPEHLYLTIAEYESDIWVMDLEW